MLDVGPHRQGSGLFSAVEEHRGARDSQQRRLTVGELIDERAQRSLGLLPRLGDDVTSALPGGHHGEREHGDQQRQPCPWKALGDYVFQFIPMSFRTGVSGGSEWLSGWTILYWAWWISWTPFVGTFLARISVAGRMREYMLGVLLVAGAVSVVWFAIFGGAGIVAERDGAADLGNARQEVSLYQLLETYPLTTGIDLGPRRLPGGAVLRARLTSRRLPEGLPGIRGFHELVAAHAEEPSQVVIGIETDRGLWVQALGAAGYQVYAINPLAVARYRDRHQVSGAKSDAGDAKLLADLVRTDRHNHRPMAGDSAEAEAIKVLARGHQNLIWARTRHTNALRSALREYYPAALEAFDDLQTAMPWPFWAALPLPPKPRI